MALEGVTDDLVMLALAVAVAAVILVAILVGLYLWVRRLALEAERGGRAGADGMDRATWTDGVDAGPSGEDGPKPSPPT